MMNDECIQVDWYHLPMYFSLPYSRNNFHSRHDFDTILPPSPLVLLVYLVPTFYTPTETMWLHFQSIHLYEQWHTFGNHISRLEHEWIVCVYYAEGQQQHRGIQ
jgi:hypothetical protein